MLGIIKRNFIYIVSQKNWTLHLSITLANAVRFLPRDAYA